MEPTARNHINQYCVGQVDYFLNIDDGQLYRGKVLSILYEDYHLNGLRVYLTLATDFGRISIKVFENGQH